MVGRQYIDFDQVRLEVLVLLHERFTADLQGMSVAEIAEKIATARNVVRLVVREEIGKGFCREDYKGPTHPVGAISALIAGTERYFDPDQRPVEITRSGIEWVGSLNDAVYLGILNKFGQEEPEIVGVPASDRTVTLNHNHSDYQATVSALGKVIEEFRNDHRLDNEDKPAKEGVLKVLEGGRRLLDGKEITAEAGQDWIVKPLKWILDKFTQGALQAAAAKALEWVCKLLGLGN